MLFQNVLMEFLVVLKKFEWSIKGVLMVFAGCFKSYLFQTCNNLQKKVSFRSCCTSCNFLMSVKMKLGQIGNNPLIFIKNQCFHALWI